MDSRPKRNIRSLRYWFNLLGFAFTLVLIAFYGVFPVGLAHIYTQPLHHRVDHPTPAEYDMAYEAMTLTTSDGLTLHGWYIPPQNGAVILLYPGYGGDRRSSLKTAAMLGQGGYGALLMDPRATGESEGVLRSYGWDDWADAAAAVDWLEARAEVIPGRIGSMGCSTGAEIALGAAALDDRVTAVVADAPYYAAMADISPPAAFNDWMALPMYIPLLEAISLFSHSRPPMSLVNAVAELAPRPLLLIAGEKSDKGFEVRQAQHYLDHAGTGADLWIIPQAGHCGGQTVAADEYARRVISFFNQAFGLP